VSEFGSEERRMRIYVWASFMREQYMRTGCGYRRHTKQREMVDRIAMMLDRALFTYDTTKPIHSIVKVYSAALALAPYMNGSK